MDEVGRLITLMAIAGGACMALGAASVWSLDTSRRVRRSLKKILRCEPHALLVAPGEGSGIGFDFGASAVVVTWDKGAWCLEYRIEELMGAELIVDGQVAARTHRGEQRRALDRLAGAQEDVRLRFVFDDVTYPDFILELWSQKLRGSKGPTPGEAVQEGNRWIARMESLLRRPVPRRGATLATGAAMAPKAGAPGRATPTAEKPGDPDLFPEDPGEAESAA